jgi:hypothetical protein
MMRNFDNPSHTVPQRFPRLSYTFAVPEGELKPGRVKISSSLADNDVAIIILNVILDSVPPNGVPNLTSDARTPITGQSSTATSPVVKLAPVQDILYA